MPHTSFDLKNGKEEHNNNYHNNNFQANKTDCIVYNQNGKLQNPLIYHTDEVVCNNNGIKKQMWTGGNNGQFEMETIFQARTVAPYNNTEYAQDVIVKSLVEALDEIEELNCLNAKNKKQFLQGILEFSDRYKNVGNVPNGKQLWKIQSTNNGIDYKQLVIFLLYFKKHAQNVPFTQVEIPMKKDLLMQDTA